MADRYLKEDASGGFLLEDGSGVLVFEPNYALVVSDQMVMSDGVPQSIVVLQLSIVCPHLGQNWSDALASSLGVPGVLQLALSDQITTLIDGSADPPQLEYQLGIVCPHLGLNWLDAASATLGGAGSALTLSVSDQDTTWADALGAGVGLRVTDQLVLVDGLGLGYGVLVAESISNWADVLAQAVVLQWTATDSANSWADALRVGYGLNVSGDQMQQSDALLAGYGLQTADQLVFSDSMGVGYGLGVSDSLNNWADALSKAAALQLGVVDSLNSWADALGIGYGLQIVTEQMTLSDSLLGGYGVGFSDQMILVDSIGAGYGAWLTDSLNSWLDLVATQLFGTALALSLADSLNSWLDVLGIGYGVQIDDSADSWSDEPLVGYGLIVEEDLNNWADFLPSFIYQFQLEVGESIQNWDEALCIEYGVSVFETLDSWKDTLRLGYGLLIQEDLNSWLDLYQSNQISNLITLSVSDQMAWTDALGLGYGNLISDALSLSDTWGLGHEVGVGDTLNSWLEGLGVGYGLGLRDQDTTWADAGASGIGLVVAASDSLLMSDTLRLGYGLIIQEDLNSWQDLYQSNIVSPQLQLIVSDSLNNWMEVLGVGYGNLVNDAMGQLDAVGVGYGLLIADDQNNWLDFISELAVFQLVISESLNFWLDDLLLDLVADSALKLQVGEQITTWTDALGIEYGLVIGDPMTMVDLWLIAGKFFGPASVLAYDVLLGVTIQKLDAQPAVGLAGMDVLQTVSIVKIGG